ncbi:MAG: hypothetical protein AABZ67_01655 [Pseudomonadota bacterium]
MPIKVNGDAAESSLIARAGLWSALAFVLNLAWEVAHVRLYTIWADAERISIAWAVVHCSLGDVAIALTMFTLAGIALRQADWALHQPWAGGTIVVIGTMAFTAWSEWYNVYQTGSWGYTASMPMILGIGLFPLLQWLILPPLMAITYRALWLKLFARHSTPSPIPAYDLTRQQK